MSENIETPKSATSASLDDARRKMYWPLKPEEGGGYFLWRQFDAELATKISEFFIGGSTSARSSRSENISYARWPL